MFLRGFKYLLIGSILTLALFNNAHAQAIPESSINVDVTPSIYGADENITILLSSYAVNLDAVSISWFVGGKSVSSGIGKKSFSTTSGAVGSETKVVASINLPEGTVQKTIFIRPNSMVLLWEAMDSHVPPFYKGKALPSPDSYIKVVAMPEIKLGSATIDPKSLTYSWKKDYSNEVEGSGYAKNSFTYINDFLEPQNTIGVTAATTSGERSATSSISISATEPEILFYKKDANLGTLWEKEITDGYLVQNGETILAEPYFISPKDVRRPDLIFSWFINGAPVSVSSLRKNSIPLGIQEGTSGTSNLRLEIENSFKIFQTVERSINLKF